MCTAVDIFEMNWKRKEKMKTEGFEKIEIWNKMWGGLWRATNVKGCGWQKKVDTENTYTTDGMTYML